MMKKILAAAAVAAALLLRYGGARTSPGDLAERFYRRLFQSEEARQVFHLEEEDVCAVFGEKGWDEERL